jgi:DNA-binding HxlR family transcriptional regulator
VQGANFVGILRRNYDRRLERARDSFKTQKQIGLTAGKTKAVLGDMIDTTSVLPAEPTDVESVHWMVQEFGDKWSLPILCRLGTGPHRFLQLKRALGPVSQRMLTRTLKKLERLGVVSRTCSEGAFPQVTYNLTEGGTVLFEAVRKLDHWMAGQGRKLRAQRPEWPATYPITKT